MQFNPANIYQEPTMNSSLCFPSNRTYALRDPINKVTLKRNRCVTAHLSLLRSPTPDQVAVSSQLPSQS